MISYKWYKNHLQKEFEILKFSQPDYFLVLLFIYLSFYQIWWFCLLHLCVLWMRKSRGRNWKIKSFFCWTFQFVFQMIFFKRKHEVWEGKEQSSGQMFSFFSFWPQDLCLNQLINCKPTGLVPVFTGPQAKNGFYIFEWWWGSWWYNRGLSCLSLLRGIEWLGRDLLGHKTKNIIWAFSENACWSLIYSGSLEEIGTLNQGTFIESKFS